MGEAGIVFDARERLPGMYDQLYQKRLLRYDGPNGEVFSYDVEVTTVTGRVLRFERKRTLDAIESFKDGKLDRQTAATDGLIVEWDEGDIVLAPGGQEPGFIRLAQNCYDHLQRMNLFCPVFFTGSFEGTVRMLERFRDHQHLAEFRDNSIGSRVEPFQMSLYRLFRGINPDRVLPDGRRLGEAMWAYATPEALAEALGIDHWPELPGLGKGAVENARRRIGLA